MPINYISYKVLLKIRNYNLFLFRISFRKQFFFLFRIFDKLLWLLYIIIICRLKSRSHDGYSLFAADLQWVYAAIFILHSIREKFFYSSYFILYYYVYNLLCGMTCYTRFFFFFIVLVQFFFSWKLLHAIVS